MSLFGKAKPCDDCITAREQSASALREVKALALAFDDLQDSVRRFTGKLARREQRETAEAAPGPANGATVPLGPHGRPMTVYERIRARRNGVLPTVVP